jgi:hypothetical protein
VSREPSPWPELPGASVSDESLKGSGSGLVRSCSKLLTLTAQKSAKPPKTFPTRPPMYFLRGTTRTSSRSTIRFRLAPGDHRGPDRHNLRPHQTITTYPAVGPDRNHRLIVTFSSADLSLGVGQPLASTPPFRSSAPGLIRVRLVNVHHDGRPAEFRTGSVLGHSELVLRPLLWAATAIISRSSGSCSSVSS